MPGNLKYLLQKSIRKAGINRQVEAAMVVECGQKIIEEFIPKEIANQAKVLYLKNQILTIACLNSVLAQELKLNEEQIIKEISQQFGSEPVRYLRFLL